MKRINIIGMLLIAMVSLVAVASASAMQPQFKTAGSFPVSFTGESTLPQEAITKAVVGGTSVNVLCQMAKDTGEISSATTVAKVKTTSTGCKLEGTSTACTTSGQASGTIVTNELSGTTGLVEAKAKAGLLLHPTTGTLFAEFTCGALIGKVTVENAVIGELAPFNGEPSTTGELRFEESGGNEKWRRFVEPEGPLSEVLVDKTSKGVVVVRKTVTFSVSVTVNG